MMPAAKKKTPKRWVIGRPKAWFPGGGGRGKTMLIRKDV
jgi:hypothetical protein